METKIIKAVFGGSRYTVTAKRTRTDYGQVLEISGVDLPSTFECIFSNSATSAGVGKKMIGSAQRVLIPDEYLTTGQTIYAWILLHDGEDDGRHMYSIKIPVDDMPDTSPEEPTPVEQSVISQAITALNSAVTTTSQKAQEATDSADRAEQAAEGVEGYAERAESAQQAAESARDIALESKVSAQTSAATATEKASEAISSATTASQSAITAESASESSQASADASAQSALRANQFAVDASARAHNASEYAQTASGYASSANTSAQTASQKASEAAQSASTAVQAKTDAITAKQASETAQGLAEQAQGKAEDAQAAAEQSASEAAESARTLVIDSTLTQPGQAADAKKTGDEITSLKSGLNEEETRARAEESRIEALFTAPTQDAVDNWLDEHPEATTTVQDGAVTWVKLNDSVQEEIDGKAPAITVVNDGKRSYSDVELQPYENYNITIPAVTDINTEYVALSEDLFPEADQAQYKVHRFNPGNTVDITGAVSSASYVYVKVNGSAKVVPNASINEGDIVTFFICYTGTITSSNYLPFRVEARLYYEDGTNSVQKNANLDTRTGNKVSINITAEKKVSHINLDWVIRTGYEFDCTVSFGAVVNSEYVEHALSSDIKLNKSGIGTNGVSMMPVNGRLLAVVDTKQYVDQSIPEGMITKEDLTYLSPEMYGAVGDGSTDDSAAVQDCINDAIAQNVAVRGYGNYNLGTTSVSIIGNLTNIYLHYVTYTGSDAGVILTGRMNYLHIDRLYAYNSTGCAFRLTTTSTLNADYNEIHFGAIYGYTNAVEYINDYGTEMMAIYYNRLYVQNIVSRNGNCFYMRANNGQFNENSFWGKHVSNSNGYFAYCEGSGNSRSTRFYEFCIESSSKNGVYGFANLINCRTGECMDRKRPDNDEGSIFVFDGVLPLGEAYNTPIDYSAVDVSNARTYEQCVEIIKDRYESGTSYALSYLAGFPAKCYKTIGFTNRLWDYYVVSNPELGNVSVKGSVLVYYNHKGFVPSIDWYHKIMVSEYHPITTDRIVPTIFDIDTDTVIYLDDSYCAVGIKEFRVIQYNGKKATIYDHNNVLVFDGKNLDAGTYIIRCHMTQGTVVVETATQTLTYSGNITRGYYFGNNEKWSVEKLNVIS